MRLLSTFCLRPEFSLQCSPFSEPSPITNNNGVDTRFVKNITKTNDDWDEIMRLEKSFYMKKVLQILESDCYSEIDKLKTLELCLFPSMAKKLTSNIMGGNLFEQDDWKEEAFS